METTKVLLNDSGQHASEDGEIDDMIPINIETPSSSASSSDSNDEHSKVEFLPPENLAPSEPNFYEWKEITNEFSDAVKELQLGELVHHKKLFGLLEAMSAIEMMDPKMDAGLRCNKNADGPLNFETAVSSNKMKLNGLENNELIGIMDAINACLISWLDGNSLAQTVFTCLYLHQPYSIQDKSLKAFCIGAYKLIQVMGHFIWHAKVFEEEDYDARGYGYELKPDLTVVKSCFMLKEAEEELIKKAKNESNEVPEDIQAVAHRLKFVRLTLQALNALKPVKAVSPNEQEMNEIIRLMNGAVDLTPTIKKTIALGTQPAENDDAPNPMGFSPSVNQRILPPTFPRFTKIKDRNASITFLEQFLQRTKQACKIIYCTNYHSALNFFIEFSKKSGSCLLSRSILQCIFFPEPNKVFGLTPMTEVLRESVKLFCAPTVLVTRTPFATSPHVKLRLEAFFKYCVNMNSFVMFIQVCGFNRARQRDKLVRLIGDFSNLQDEAERVDAYLNEINPDENDRRPYLSTWVLYHCLRAMSMYILSGLELELYSVHEYLYIFWYLSDFLYNWIISTLKRAECLADQVKSVNPKAKKPKPKKKSIKLYCREIMFSQALKCMFCGYYSALAGFHKAERIPQPLVKFDNEQIRFEHRFAPFNALITPTPVSYAQFKDYREYTLKNNSINLYGDASNFFHQARTILESIPNTDPEITDIIQIAKVNFVVMNLLANGHKKDSKSSPEFDFSIHKYFPIIKQN